MKVLHLIGGGDVGGAKIHVLSLVKELSKYIDVKIISFRPGMFTDEARTMGINIEVVKSGSIFSDVKNVVRIAKNEGYQMIHSHGAKANMVSVLGSRSLKLPTVTTVHSDYRLDYLQSLIKRYTFGLINTICLRYVNYYIAVSDNFKQMLIERKFNPDNIFTVYNGIDFNQPLKEYTKKEFFERFQIPFIDNEVVVGILARLHPVKGLDTFLEAAKRVIQTNSRVRFLIGGDGEERRALEQKAQWLGISDRVHFLGFILEPYEFMNSLDINLLTSISESFPYSILEGTRLKKPIISSDVGGISDLVESGVHGFLFKPGDVEVLSKHILTLVHDPSLRSQMGEKIYDKASTGFSLHNMCQTQLNIYRSILTRPK